MDEKMVWSIPVFSVHHIFSGSDYPSKNSFWDGPAHGAISHATVHESGAVSVKAISQVPSLGGPVDSPGHGHLQAVNGIIS